MGSTYCLIISSAKTSDERKADARDQMASLFQLKDKQLDKLFSGKPLRFMKNIDYNTAQGYRDDILKLGIACQIEEYTVKKDAPTKSKEAPDTKFQILREEKKQELKNYYCPVCHVQQTNKLHCQFCKYDLEVYRNTMAEKKYIEIEGAGYIPDRRISHRRDNFFVRREMIRVEKFSDRRVNEERRKEAGVWQGAY